MRAAPTSLELASGPARGSLREPLAGGARNGTGRAGSEAAGRLARISIGASPASPLASISSPDPLPAS